MHLLNIFFKTYLSKHQNIRMCILSAVASIVKFTYRGQLLHATTDLAKKRIYALLGWWLWTFSWRTAGSGQTNSHRAVRLNFPEVAQPVVFSRSEHTDELFSHAGSSFSVNLWDFWDSNDASGLSVQPLRDLPFFSARTQEPRHSREVTQIHATEPLAIVFSSKSPVRRCHSIPTTRGIPLLPKLRNSVFSSRWSKDCFVSERLKLWQLLLLTFLQQCERRLRLAAVTSSGGRIDGSTRAGTSGAAVLQFVHWGGGGAGCRFITDQYKNILLFLVRGKMFQTFTTSFFLQITLLSLITNQAKTKIRNFTNCIIM